MENQKGSAGQKSLSLVDMASAFIVFGIGMSSAILVFLLEVIYYKIHKGSFTAVLAFFGHLGPHCDLAWHQLGSLLKALCPFSRR